MVGFKLRFKSNIFITRNTEHSSTLILNLNDTPVLYPFPASLNHAAAESVIFLSQLGVFKVTSPAMSLHLGENGEFGCPACFTLEEFSLRLCYKAGNPRAWVITRVVHQCHSHLIFSVLAYLLHKNIFTFFDPSLYTSPLPRNIPWECSLYMEIQAQTRTEKGLCPLTSRLL